MSKLGIGLGVDFGPSALSAHVRPRIQCATRPPQPAWQWGWSPCVLPYGHGGMCQYDPPVKK